MTLFSHCSVLSLIRITGLFVLLSLGLMATSFAQTAANSSLLSGTPGAKTNIFGETKSHILIRQESFVSPDYDQTSTKSFQFFGGGMDTLSRVRKENDIENGLQAQVSGAVSPAVTVLSYLNISQIYWKQDNFVVGRRKENWSNLDDIWNMGLYQPLFRWNPIQPESQGLTGVFLQFHKEDSFIPWGVVLFGSPIFIPHQDSGFEVKNGKFVASNPYFGQRPVRAVINGQNDEVNYKVQKPDTEDVVRNHSFAGKAYLGDLKSGASIQLGFANKPANELALGIDAYASPNSSVEVTVSPTISYHTLTSADLQYAWDNLAVGVSGVSEVIEEPEFKEEVSGTQWTYAKYDNSTLVSPYIRLKFRGFEIITAYLDISGAEKTPQGNLATEAQGFLSNRYPFNDSYLMKLSLGRRFPRGQILRLSTAYQQGVKNEYALMTGSLSYQFDPSWTFSLGGQLIKVADNVAGQDTLYSSFVNNDSATVGVQYVF